MIARFVLAACLAHDLESRRRHDSVHAGFCISAKTSTLLYASVFGSGPSFNQYSLAQTAGILYLCACPSPRAVATTGVLVEDSHALEVHLTAGNGCPEALLDDRAAVSAETQ